MAEVSHSYSRKRNTFGGIPEFQANEPEQIADIAPSAELKEKYTVMDPYETEVQNVPTLAENQTNTERTSLKPHGQQHVEGGWPAHLEMDDVEDKMRYSKKLDKEPFPQVFRGLVEQCTEKYLKQNNAIDIYGMYYNEGADKDAAAAAAAAAATEPPMGPPTAKTVTVFKDPSPVKRTATSVSWSGDGKRIAVAYCNLRFQGSVEGMTTSSHIWDILNPNEPAETLTPPSPLCSIQYYTKDPHLIAGGSYNGVVQYWDTRQPSRPVARSAIEDSHKDPVWDIKWLQSKAGEILSISTDGQAFIWDCRKPEKPVEINVLKKFENESLTLQPKSNEGGAKGVLGGTCIDYDPMVGGPSKYMVGTEQGTILSVNRKGKSQTEKIGANTFNGHHGPVYACQRNPHNGKYFLTVGDWTARLWFEDNKSMSMFTTFYHKAHLTSGCWHPIRPGVFFTTRMDGVVDVWDLMYRQATPVLSVQLSDYALHTIRPSPGEGHHLAVGGVDGTVTLLELSPALYTTSNHEKLHIQKMFENESARDKNVDKVLKLREKKDKGKGHHDHKDKDGGGFDEQSLQDVADKYLKEVEVEEEGQKKDVDTVESKRTKLVEDIQEGLEVDEA